MYIMLGYVYYQNEYFIIMTVNSKCYCPVFEQTNIKTVAMMKSTQLLGHQSELYVISKPEMTHPIAMSLLAK